MKASTLVLWVALLPVGCGGYVWQKPEDLARQEWLRHEAECASEVREALPDPAVARDYDLYVERRRLLFEQCMGRHGYERSWTWGMVK